MVLNKENLQKEEEWEFKKIMTVGDAIRSNFKLSDLIDLTPFEEEGMKLNMDFRTLKRLGNAALVNGKITNATPVKKIMLNLDKIFGALFLVEKPETQ